MLLGALSWALLSLPSQAATCRSPVPDSELVQPGTLVMATNPTLRPLQFVDSFGALRGMRIELGEAIAKRLCLTPQYVRVDFRR
jgi:polar amino acid transport system substrate-binding protein